MIMSLIKLYDQDQIKRTRFFYEYNEILPAIKLPGTIKTQIIRIGALTTKGFY